MKDKERLELTFNSDTERDLWEYIESLGKKKATVVKAIIRDRMYADRLGVQGTTLQPTIQNHHVPPAASPVVETPNEPVVEEKENIEESDQTFDVSRSILFKAKEI